MLTQLTAAHFYPSETFLMVPAHQVILRNYLIPGVIVDRLAMHMIDTTLPKGQLFHNMTP